ncbi:MAG: STAS domain-containing protein [Acidobacteriota bacterium]|nr:STAS domain-containing protein [Acidobacteriota bacterium]
MEVPAGEGPRTILDTPDLSIVLETSDDMVVARVAGRLDGTTAESFRRAMEWAPLGDHRTCLLDMADVTFVASEGLRALLLYRQFLSKNLCRLSLCSLQDSVQSVFQISGFTSVLAIYPDAEAAADDSPVP